MSEADAHDESGCQRLYLHIGLAKSGTTYLQTILANNRVALRGAGYVYPYVRREGMFLAAVEMAGSPERWGVNLAEIKGTFAHLVRRGRRLGGSVVLSHEVYSSASDVQVRVLADLLVEFEVHVVVTARDLGRTLPAQWQENVKNGRVQSFAELAAELIRQLDEDPENLDEGFWTAQNLVSVLERWQAVTPPERTHVVTCPPSGAPPDLLWHRFAEAIDLPPDIVDLSVVPPRNESLGTAQIAFLRRVLAALAGRLEQPWFSRIAKRWFAQTLLAGVVGSDKPVTPAPMAERLREVAGVWIDVVRKGNYRIHGDLDELLPDVAAGSVPHPDEATAGEMLDGLPGVVADMLVRTGQLRSDLAEVERRNAALTESCQELGTRVEQLTAELEERTGRRHRWLPYRIVHARPAEPDGAARD